MEKALGLIETLGLIGAIEAADVGLKAANVSLIDKELSTGGLVTIKFTGDVGAVKAAVEAGSAAAQKVGVLVSVHVISRMSNDLEKIIHVDTKGDGTKDIEKTILFNEKEYNLYGKGGIGTLKVVKLRKIARKLEIVTMSKEEIKFARKAELIAAIRNHSEKGRS